MYKHICNIYYNTDIPHVLFHNDGIHSAYKLSRINGPPEKDQNEHKVGMRAKWPLLQAEMGVGSLPLQLSAVTLHSLASFGWFTLIHSEPVNGPSHWDKNEVSKNPTWL